ncbi:MAG: hypothetical protein U0P30_05795 [Vicinamibacterales bacterium]
MGAVASAVETGTAPTELRNLRVSAKAIRKLRKLVCTQTLDQRLTLPGLDPRRADLIVAGTVLVDTLLRTLKRRRDHAPATWPCRKAWSSISSSATAGGQTRWTRY